MLFHTSYFVKKNSEFPKMAKHVKSLFTACDVVRRSDRIQTLTILKAGSVNEKKSPESIAFPSEKCKEPETDMRWDINLAHVN